jgi:hypothetical protein
MMPFRWTGYTWLARESALSISSLCEMGKRALVRTNFEGVTTLVPRPVQTFDLAFHVPPVFLYSHEERGVSTTFLAHVEFYEHPTVAETRRLFP